MADQAERLRGMMRELVPHAAQGATAPAFAAPQLDAARVVAVTSGKGGVGKTTIVANLAIALAERGRSVAVLDADLALGNVDVLLGLHPTHNLSHVIAGEKTLEEIAIDGPSGITVLPAGSGIVEMAQLSAEALTRLLEQAEAWGRRYQYLFLDTAAGLADQARRFALAADRVIVVTHPEPPAYTDAYAMIKALVAEAPSLSIGLLINNAQSRQEALEIAHSLDAVARRFLSRGAEFLGYVPLDPHVRAAVRRQRPVLHDSPHGPAATSIRRLAAYLEQSTPPARHGGFRRFLERVLSLAGGSRAWKE